MAITDAAPGSTRRRRSPSHTAIDGKSRRSWRWSAPVYTNPGMASWGYNSSSTAICSEPGQASIFRGVSPRYGERWLNRRRPDRFFWFRKVMRKRSGAAAFTGDLPRLDFDGLW